MVTERRPGKGRWQRRADALTDLAMRRPKRVLAVAGLAFLVGAPVGFTAFTSLDPYEFVDPGTESARAIERLEDASGLRADASVIALVKASPKTTEGRARIAEVAAELESVKGVAPLASTPGLSGGTVTAPHGGRTYLVAAVDVEMESADITEGLESALGEEDDVLLGGIVVADQQIAEQSEADLRLAEALAFPLLLILSLVFFRGLVAATLPLLVGGFAIVGALFAMRLIHEVFPLSVLALNVVTALGFGLAIDYSLFVVTRFREELARGADTEGALRITLGTAGHAIVFSGLTVACAMASLLLFPQRFLESMGVGGIAVALVAATAGLFVLPAILGLLGERVNALSPDFLQRSRRATELPDNEGRWYRFSRWVMRRPVGVATGAALLLLAMGLPLTQIEFVPGDASALPSGSAGAVDRAVIADFRADPTTPMIIQLEGDADGSRGELRSYRASLEKLKGVAVVTPPAQVGPGVVRLDLVSSRGHYTPEAKDLVREVRAVPAPMPVRVGGLAASQIDEERSVARHIPPAATVLAVTTMLILFAMTRSVLLPLKALVMNVLSLAAALGLLVLVFQEDNLSGLFGFESQGGILIGIAVLIFAAGFGLSTDYGVFSLSRIKELHESGHSNSEAVAIGLERTGRMITSAALLFAVAMGALVTGELIGVKETGFGVAAAVLIDATLVRALLVPSLMALLGERNWWCPSFSRGRDETPAPLPSRAAAHRSMLGRMEVVTARPGYELWRPNREKAQSQTTKAIVAFVLLVSAGIIAVIVIGGWERMQSSSIALMSLAWAALYVVFAILIARWNRGLLPVASALAVIMTIFATVAAPGWFARSKDGLDSPLLPEDLVGLFVVVLIPVQILLIVVCLIAFNQEWHVEEERPTGGARLAGEDDDDGYDDHESRASSPPSPSPA